MLLCVLLLVALRELLRVLDTVPVDVEDGEMPHELVLDDVDVELVVPLFVELCVADRVTLVVDVRDMLAVELVVMELVLDMVLLLVALLLLVADAELVMDAVDEELIVEVEVPDMLAVLLHVLLPVALTELLLVALLVPVLLLELLEAVRDAVPDPLPLLVLLTELDELDVLVDVALLLYVDVPLDVGDTDAATMHTMAAAMVRRTRAPTRCTVAAR